MNISNAEAAFRGLLYGVPLTIENRTYKLFKPGELITTPSFEGTCDTYWLGMECNVIGDNGSRTAYVGAQIEFDTMVSLLQKITEEQRADIAATITLNDFLRKKL